MATIPFKVLGCSGSEAKGVHPCSFMLGDEVLFDAGSAASLLDIQAQQHLRAVYLTHCHLDHIKDLAFLGENVFSLLTQPIVVRGNAAVLESVRKHLFNDVIWPDFTRLPTPQRPVFRFEPLVEGQAVVSEAHPQITIEPIEVHHPGPTFGFIVGGKRRAVVYTGDTGSTQRIWERVNALPHVTDILLETTFPNRLVSLAKDSQHLTTQGLVQELTKIKSRDIRVHVYHTKVPYLEEIEREINALGNARLRLLKPGDVFELD